MTTDTLQDQRGHAFFVVDNDLIDKHGGALGAYGIAIYAVLVRHADKNGASFPSRARIAKLIGCSVKSVDRHLITLLELGLITKDARVTTAGDQDSNTYTIKPVRGGDSESLPGEPESLGVATLSRQGGDSESPEVNTLNKTQGKKEKPGGAGAPPGRAPREDATDAVLTGVQAEPTANGVSAEGGPSKPTSPRKGVTWDLVSEEIALSVTGDAGQARTERGGRRAWVGRLTGLVGQYADDNPLAALAIWEAFQEHMPQGQWERFVTEKSAYSAFGRWASNGGMATCRAIAKQAAS